MADSEVAVCNLALLNIGDTAGLIGSLDDPSTQAQVCKVYYAQTRDELIRSFKWPWAQRRAYPAQLGGALYSATQTYATGQYVSFQPSLANVVNAPESIPTFVYLSLVDNNLGNSPDLSPTKWRQISRAAWAYCFLPPGDVLKIHGLYHRLRNPREDQQVPFELGYEPAPGPGTILFTDAGLPWEVFWNSGSSAQQVSIELEYTAQVTDPKQFPPDFTHALAWQLATKLVLALRKDSDEAEKAMKASAVAVAEAVAAARQEQRRDPEPVPSWIAARASRRRGHW